MSRSLLLLLALLLLPGAALAQAPDDPLAARERALIALIKKVRPSVVQVHGSFHGQSLSWSGVVVDARGHIVSAGQALALTEALTVTFGEDSAPIPAKLLGFDQATSLGVIKLDPAAVASAGAKLIPATPGDVAKLELGSLVVVVGNPFGLRGSVAPGIISGKDRAIRLGPTLLTGMLQTTAPINPGDAGGLVSDRRGQLVGVITSTFGRGLSGDSLQSMLRDRELMKIVIAAMTEGERTKDPEAFFAALMKQLREELIRRAKTARPKPFPGYGLSAQNINFILPVDQVNRVARDLINHGTVRRGWLGAKVQVLGDARGWRLVVEEAVPDGPAAHGGLKAGDQLLSFDDKPLQRILQLKQYLDSTAPGDTIRLRIRRHDRELTLQIKLSARP